MTINENYISYVIENTVRKYITEKKKKAKSNKKDKKRSSSTRKKSVLNALNNKKINNAQLAYKLYPKMTKDAARSIFSKKSREARDDKGFKRVFSPTEINTIAKEINAIDV